MEHPMFANEPFTEREAWLYLIEHAAFEARSFRIGKHVVRAERGQLVTSVRFLASAWQWSKSRVDRFLKRLEIGTMIGTVAGHDFTVISVCNYEQYQGSQEGSWDTVRDTGGTPAGHQRDKSKEGKELNEVYSLAAQRVGNAKRGSRLPADWRPSGEDRAFARSEGFSDERIDRIAAEFVDYWTAVPGQKGVKLDWSRTFRNRIRQLADRRAEKQPVTGRPSSRGFTAALGAVVSRSEMAGMD